MRLFFLSYNIKRKFKALFTLCLPFLWLIDWFLFSFSLRVHKPSQLRANAQKNRAKSANRGHSSKPNLPSFSVCNKVLMSF